MFSDLGSSPTLGNGEGVVSATSLQGECRHFPQSSTSLVVLSGQRTVFLLLVLLTRHVDRLPHLCLLHPYINVMLMMSEQREKETLDLEE